MLRQDFGLRGLPEGVARRLLRSAEISLDLAEKKGVWQRCRHFTFVFRGNKLVSTGVNSHKTHPRNLLYAYVNKRQADISWMVGTHSEMSAVLRLGDENPGNLTLVNTRVNRSGFLDYSRPCPGCTDMIIKAGFREVYYTLRSGEFVRMEIDRW